MLKSCLAWNYDYSNQKKNVTVSTDRISENVFEVSLTGNIAISSNSHAQIFKFYTHGHFCFCHLIWNFFIRNFATETCTYLQILYERLFSSLSPNWEDIGVSAVHKLTGLNYVSTYEQKL